MTITLFYIYVDFYFINLFIKIHSSNYSSNDQLNYKPSTNKHPMIAIFPKTLYK